MNGEILPPGNQDDESADDDSRGGNSNHPHIGHFRYTANELADLWKVDPELAKQILKNTERQDRRRHTSERLGIIASVMILISSMASVVALILAVALLIRVILTGEWSDTSWFGKLIDFLARTSGAIDSAKDDD